MKDKNRIVIVDDEVKMCRSLQLYLDSVGKFTVETAYSAEEGLKLIKDGTDVVVTDLSMPGMDGMKFLKEIKRLFDDLEVIIMTAYSSIPSAIEAIKNGAFDYLAKPFSNEQFLLTIERACTISQLKKENRRLRQGLLPSGRDINLIGNSTHIKSVLNLIAKASESDASVLITGESGTGKEIVARAIHSTGNRKNGVFVAINCTAIPDNLLESELFGYERGAFTGATTSKPGKVELAHSGTLFLDEIGDMDIGLQAKLLRFIESREVERIGSLNPRKVDVRIIASTNRPLKELIEQGKFREDLYYRLNVINIHLLPLRERKEDLVPLIAYFLEEKSKKLGIKKKELAGETLEVLLNYSYPGNVRELENIIECSLILSSSDTIYPWELPLLKNEHNTLDLSGIPVENGFAVLENFVKNAEKNILKQAIERYKNLSNEEIAEKLGTTRRVLEMRMKEYDIKKK
jgi:DNA-binding NtrC family response regulator